MVIQQVNLVQASALCQQKNFPVLFLTHHRRFAFAAGKNQEPDGDRQPPSAAASGASQFDGILNII
ncbi:MAG: hypothetical protein OEV73_04015 [Desulfobulbaceae bacterium]|nr:hypothetical protein [Desulfobulbaceae bacterium]